MRVTRIIARASMLAILAVGTWATAAASPGEHVDSWRFDVRLDDKPIGVHEFVLRQEQDSQVIDIEASFDVRFLRIPVYSYRHQNTERWSNGCLVDLESRTDDNGDLTNVTASRVDQEIVVESGGERRQLSNRCVMSFAYWNRDFIEQDALLNAQTGEMVDVVIESVAATPPDTRFEAESLDAFRITSPADDAIDIEVAYARDSGRWVYLESRLDNGRTLRYLPAESTAARDRPLSDGGRS